MRSIHDLVRSGRAVLARQPRPLLAQLARGRPCVDDSPTAGTDVRTAGDVQAGSRLARVFRGAERYPCLSLYVHGSWADSTTTAFSDLDDLVVIESEMISSTTELRRVARWLDKVEMRFARLDPLQHHGHWVLDRAELACLDESYMPLLVLRDALVVQGERTIRAQVDMDATRAGLARNIRSAAESARNLLRLHNNGTISVYEMKMLVGTLLLLPAYASQYKGLARTKREAIESVGQWSPVAGPTVIAWCTYLRDNWDSALVPWSMRLLWAWTWIVRNPRVYRATVARLSPRFPDSRFPASPSDAIDEYLSDLVGVVASR